MDQSPPSHDPGIKNIEDVCTAWAQKKYGSEYTVKSVKDKHLKVLSEGNINYGESEESSPVEIKRSDLPSLKNWSGSPKYREFSVQSTKKYTCGFTKNKGTQFSGDLSVNVALPAALGLKATMGGQIQLSRTTSETSQKDETSTTVEKFEQRPWSILLVQKVTTQKVITQPYTLDFRLKGTLKITLQKTNGKTESVDVNVVDLYPDGKIETDAKGKKSVLLSEEGTCETKEVYEVMERKEPDAEKLMQIIQEGLLDDNKKKIAEEVSDLPKLLDVMFSVSQKSPVKEGVDGLVDMLKNTEPEKLLVFVDILKEHYPEYKELVGLLDPRPMYLLADSVRHISNLSGVVDHYFVTKKEREVKDSLESGRRVILHGMPGSGKTQLAYKLAGEYAEVHPHSVVWVIDGSEEEKLNDGITNLQQSLSGETSVDISLFQSLVSRWKHFLLLINDLSPQVAIPTQVLSSSAKIIVTTQDSLMESEDIANIPIEGFTEDEAVKFLSPKMPPETSPEQMRDLANLFSRLPLGLAAARAAIHRGNMTVEEYKLQLQGGREALEFKVLMSREDNWLQTHYKKEHHQEAARNIFAALQLAIDKLDDLRTDDPEEKMCKVMLQPCAFLEPNNIPVLILRSALEHPTIGADAYFTERMRMYSLGNIVGAGVKRRLSIHGVTQMAIRLYMDQQQQTTWIDKVLQILVKFFVKDMTYSEIHKFSLELMPHVEAALKYADKLQLELDAEYPLMKARLLMVYGHLLIQKETPALSVKQLEEAKKLLLQFVRIHQDTSSAQSLEEDPDDDTIPKMLYQSLAEKSRSLKDGFIEETVIRRIITKHHLSAVSDKLGAEHRTTLRLRNMMERFEPLTMEMYDALVDSDLAIPLIELKGIFLPELYISIMFTLSKALFDLEDGSRSSGSGDRCNLITLALDMCTEVTNKTGLLVMVRFLADFILLRGVKVADKVISRVPDTVEPILSEAAETLLIVHETKEKDAATRFYDSGLLVRCGTQILHELNYYTNKQGEERKRFRLFSWRQDKKRGKEMMKPVERSQAECYMIHGVVKVVVKELEEAAAMFWKAYRVELEREEYHPRMGDALRCLFQVHIAQKELGRARDWAEQYLQLAKEHWPERVTDAKEELRYVCSLISTEIEHVTTV